MADDILTTDDQILASIGEGRDDSDSETTDSTAEDTSASDETSAPTADSGGYSDESQAQENRGPQDLVGQGGEVIARGGAERRVYERTVRENRDLQGELRELRAQVQAYQDGGSLGTQFNLTPDELSAGAQLMESFKQDPSATINQLLTQAQSQGINVDGVGGHGVDMKSMQDMINNAIQPLTEARQQELDTQRRTEEATNIYNDFFDRFPDAKVHEGAVARLLEEDQSLSLDAAYYKLQSFYASRGLDWKVPLGTYIQNAREAQQSGSNGSGNTQQSVPAGGSIVPDASSTDEANLAVSADTSMSDIIRQAINESGIT